jgi:1,4-dihydroxy-6-naphthoate synthase
MTRPLTLGYSPCPNDTFIFHALVHGLVPTTGFTVRERLEDVETLNRLAGAEVLDLTKVSCHALGHLRQHYALLHSGGALGRGCGPLVIARQPTSMAALRGRRIAIPGTLTTANLLLQLSGAGYDHVVPMPFDQIMPALRGGMVEAGVIIHESRFTYRDAGFHAVQDLGAWWEAETGLPIPARRHPGAPRPRRRHHCGRRCRHPRQPGACPRPSRGDARLHPCPRPGTRRRGDRCPHRALRQ